MSLGIPSLEPAASLYPGCIGFDFDQISHHQSKLLAGNGMHAGQLGAFVAYVLSRCARRSTLQRLCPSVRSQPGGDDQDSDSDLPPAVP